MATRVQFCPICEKKTIHEYKSMSLLAFFILLLCGVWPGLAYLYVSSKRADRTSVCKVDHRLLRDARDDDRARALVESLLSAQRRAESPTPTRGRGFMSHE